MKCLWCGTVWPQVHVTRMIGHSSSNQGCMWSLAWGKDDDAIIVNEKLFNRKNSDKVGKKRAHKGSVQSVKDVQSSLDQELVTPNSPPLSFLSLNKGQIMIQAGFDCALSSDIYRSNDVLLEMAIADFFHCENIAVWWGVSLGHQQGKN